ncbi:MAG: M56 family metallopeptidase [Chitinivibrionales bacterium]|nr:M56 family metallopeptidase [Chitinivibrionales bacterium]
MITIITFWQHYMFAMFWQSSIVILLLFGIYFIARKRSAAFCYLLLCVGLVKLCLPPSISSDLSLASLRRPMTPIIHQATVGDNSLPLVSGANSSADRIQPAYSEPVSKNTEHTNVRSLPLTSSVSKPKLIKTAFFYSWACIVFFLLGINGWRIFRIKKRFFYAWPVLDVSIRQIFNKCIREIGLKKPIGLETINDLHSPVVMGIVHLRIIIPQKLLAEVNEAELRAIFFHELAHVKRRDIPVNFFQTIFTMIWFFNPLLWWLNSLIRKTRERACDDMAVLLSRNNPADFASGLLKTSRLCTAGSQVTPGLLGIADRGPDIAQRIKRLLGGKTVFARKISVLEMVILILIGAVVIPQASTNSKKSIQENKSRITELDFTGISIVSTKQYPFLSAWSTGADTVDFKYKDSLRVLPPNADSLVFGKMIINGDVYICAHTKLDGQDTLGLKSFPGMPTRNVDTAGLLRIIPRKIFIIDKNRNRDLSDDTPTVLNGVVIGPPYGGRLVEAFAYDSVFSKGKTIHFQISTGLAIGTPFKDIQSMSIIRQDALKGMLHVFSETFPAIIYTTGNNEELTSLVIKTDKKSFQLRDAATENTITCFNLFESPVFLPNAKFHITGLSADKSKLFVRDLQPGIFKNPQLKENDKAPDFSVKDITGKTEHLKELLSKNDYVLLNFYQQDVVELNPKYWEAIKIVLNKHIGKTEIVIVVDASNFDSVRFHSSIPLIREDVLHGSSPVFHSYGIPESGQCFLINKEGTIRFLTWGGSRQVIFWPHPELGLGDTKTMLAEYEALTK